MADPPAKHKPQARTKQTLKDLAKAIEELDRRVSQGEKGTPLSRTEINVLRERVANLQAEANGVALDLVPSDTPADTSHGGLFSGEYWGHQFQRVTHPFSTGDFAPEKQPTRGDLANLRAEADALNARIDSGKLRWSDDETDPNKALGTDDPVTAGARWQMSTDEIETLYAGGSADFTPEQLARLYPDQAVINRFAAGQGTDMTPAETYSPEVLDRQRTIDVPIGETGQTMGQVTQGLSIPWGDQGVAELRFERNRAKERAGIIADAGGQISQAVFRQLEEFDAKTDELRGRQAWRLAMNSTVPGDDVGITTTPILSIRDFMMLPETLSTDEIATLQTELFKAGRMPGWFQDYDASKPLSAQAPLGDRHDPTFRKAWTELGRQWMANQDKSITDLIDQSSATFAPVLAAAAKAEKERKLAALGPVTLSDPAGLRTALDDIGVRLLGRTPTNSEKAGIVAYIHELQRTTQGKQRDAILADQPRPETTEVDVQAQMEEQLKARHPVEVGAHDVAGEYALFTRLLSGPGAG